MKATMSARCHCGRFIRHWFCQHCWDRTVISLRIRIHIAFEAAGLCHANCVWWPRSPVREAPR